MVPFAGYDMPLSYGDVGQSECLQLGEEYDWGRESRVGEARLSERERWVGSGLPQQSALDASRGVLRLAASWLHDLFGRLPCALLWHRLCDCSCPRLLALFTLPAAALLSLFAQR